MTIFSGTDQNFTNDALIADGAVIDGTRLRLHNSESGRIVGGVTFIQGGHFLTNALGGIIRVATGSDPSGTNAIAGSIGDDTVVNDGLVNGRVSLGDGNDRIISNAFAQWTAQLDLGAGDDRLDSNDRGGALNGNGGAGRDTISVSHSGQASIHGFSLAGFEDLIISGTGQLVNFSGYQTITLGTPQTFGMALIGSANPLVDLHLVGNSFRLHTSSLRSVTGGAGNEKFELNQGGVVSGAVSLRGGDDTLSMFGFPGQPSPVLPSGGVDGGSGMDVLTLQTTDSEVQSFDFAAVTGFEWLTINSGYIAKGLVKIANASGFDRIDIGSVGAGLELTSSQLVNANISGGFGFAISLDASSSILSYGFHPDSTSDRSTDIQQGDDQFSTTFHNAGAVITNIQFYIGDDYYDGSKGRVGGVVYGNAGNDILLGGAAADHFEGGFGADQLSGSSGPDILKGGSGNDVLHGGAGIDLMAGGPGNDIYYVDHVNDQTWEDLSEGDDRLYTSVSYILRSGSAVDLVSTDNHIGTGSINLTGNELANVIYGNAGRNILNGLGGVDVLVGLEGDDWYLVDNIGDQVLEFSGQGADRIFAAADYRLGSGAHIELLSTDFNAGTAAIDLFGNELANVIYGNAGVNLLDGLAGVDVLVGLEGNDWYRVDHIADRVVEYADSGTDRVFAAVSFTLEAGSAVELLTTDFNPGTAAINLTGNESANTIYGNAGANVLDGRGGADVLVGLEGDDWYHVESAADRVVEYAGGGIDRVFASVSFALEAASSVDLLTTDFNAGTAPINLSGNELANTIYGNAGANILDGKASADTLVGMEGADSFAFSTALGGDNVDRIVDFVSGQDRIVLLASVFAGLGSGTLAAGAFVAGTQAADADDRILYDTATGTLSYDADGNGAVAAIAFATVSPLLPIIATDFSVI